MNLRIWGPYLSERQWSTVCEDYRANGIAWDYFPTITHAAVTCLVCGYKKDFTRTSGHQQDFYLLF